MWHRSIKNFLRICNSNISGDCNKLLADCYLANHWIMNHDLCQKSYLGSMKSILLKLGYKEIWDNQFSRNSKTTDDIRQSLKCYYMFSWEMAISNVDEKSKLRFYKQLKNVFEFEKYLFFLTNNFKLRKLITKLRISAHNLHIEMGRYKSL